MSVNHALAVRTRPIRELTASDQARFWAKVDKSGECWLWTASLTRGYGNFGVGGREDHQTLYAHRVAYTLERGPIPEGMVLDHLCRTTACVNPEHLEIVTQRENSLRGKHVYGTGGRTRCTHGHDMTDETNVYVTPGGSKQCRACWKVTWVRSGRAGRLRRAAAEVKP